MWFSNGVRNDVNERISFAAARGVDCCAASEFAVRRRHSCTQQRSVEAPRCGGKKPLATFPNDKTHPVFLRCSTRSMLRPRGIRKEVIGHRMASFLPQSVHGRRGNLAFVLLHQPARK